MAVVYQHRILLSAAEDAGFIGVVRVLDVPDRVPGDLKALEAALPGPFRNAPVPRFKSLPFGARVDQMRIFVPKIGIETVSSRANMEFPAFPAHRDSV